MMQTASSSLNDLRNWSPYAKQYDPLKAGSIDGTDLEPHDKAVSRAMISHYDKPYGLRSKADRTLFVSKFSSEITKQDLKEFFSRHGEVVSISYIIDIVTGHSAGYAFVEMRTEEEARMLARRLTDPTIKEEKIFIDMEVGRKMKGWIPRRLGGGFGGKKESGQLRFGGKDRPFKRPLVPPVAKPGER